MHSESWLTSSLIDFILLKFARVYSDVHFMPTEFAHHILKEKSFVSDNSHKSSSENANIQSSYSSKIGNNDENSMKNEPLSSKKRRRRGTNNYNKLPVSNDNDFVLTDILGNKINCSTSSTTENITPKIKSHMPIVFFVNVKNMHWNLVRIQHWPTKELQLFEPMGKPAARNANKQISVRDLPPYVIKWLDAWWPLDDDGNDLYTGSTFDKSLAKEITLQKESDNLKESSSLDHNEPPKLKSDETYSTGSILVNSHS